VQTQNGDETRVKKKNLLKSNVDNIVIDINPKGRKASGVSYKPAMSPHSIFGEVWYCKSCIIKEKCQSPHREKGWC